MKQLVLYVGAPLVGLVVAVWAALWWLARDFERNGLPL